MSLLLLNIVLVRESDATHSGIMTLQSKCNRTTFSQVIDQALLILTVHGGTYGQSMPICRKAYRLNRERRHDLFDDGLVIDIVENNLTIKTYGAHQKLVDLTEAQAFDITRMLLKLADHLLGVHVIDANGSMVCYTAECFFYQVRELDLVDAA